MSMMGRTLKIVDHKKQIEGEGLEWAKNSIANRDMAGEKTLCSIDQYFQFCPGLRIKRAIYKYILCNFVAESKRLAQSLCQTSETSSSSVSSQKAK